MKIAEAPEADKGLVPAPAGMPPQRIWLLARAALIIALTAGCATAVVTGWVSPARVVLAIGFLLFCPGLALAELLEIHDLAQLLAFAAAASLALDTLVSLALIYSGAFSIPLAVAILAAMTLTALAAALVRALSHPHRFPPDDPAP